MCLWIKTTLGLAAQKTECIFSDGEQTRNVSRARMKKACWRSRRGRRTHMWHQQHREEGPWHPSQCLPRLCSPTMPPVFRWLRRSVGPDSSCGGSASREVTHSTRLTSSKPEWPPNFLMNSPVSLHIRAKASLAWPLPPSFHPPSFLQHAHASQRVPTTVSTLPLWMLFAYYLPHHLWLLIFLAVGAQDNKTIVCLRADGTTELSLILTDNSLLWSVIQ